jgi:GntR family transcriptional regulator
MVTLNRDLPVPLYHQVKTWILGGIENGLWRPDERLPSEDDLADKFSVSKITVRQALRDLAQLGYVRREQGRGTFVQRPPLIEGPRKLTSFSEEMRRQGVTATSKVLEQGTIPASADVASMLGLVEEMPVFRLRRLRLADGDPMGVQTTYIPAPLVPGIEHRDFTRASLYDVLGVHYDLFPSIAHETHYAFAVGSEDAALLRVAEGAPAMGADLVARLADGRPLEYVKSVMRADRDKIVLDLVRQPGGRQRAIEESSR